MTEKVNVVCPQCGATNRFPVDATGKTVVCGRCKSPLPVPGRVLEPTPDQLTVLIQKGALPLLIDFYSETCVPCRMMHPIIESLAARRAGDLTVARINTAACPELVRAFRIEAVPTFVMMRGGVERGRTMGAMNETDFSLWAASKS
jgi:thioredoxin 2